MVVQVRAQGTVVDRLEKLVAGCGGTMVRASELKAQPTVADLEAMSDEEFDTYCASPAAQEDRLVDEEDKLALVDAEPVPVKVMSTVSEKALDVAVLTNRPVTTGMVRSAVEASPWKARKLLTAGSPSTDHTVVHVAKRLGIEAMVIPAEVGDDRREMLFWFADAVLVLSDLNDSPTLEAAIAEARHQGKLVSVFGAQPAGI